MFMFLQIVCGSILSVLCTQPGTATKLLPVAQAPLGASANFDSVDAYIQFERPKAIERLLNNIGTIGANAGVVIASPSKFDPDYLYSWIRDSSLVVKVLIDQLDIEQRLEERISSWISSQARIQKQWNPSGCFDSGGLGEPKFEIDETAFQGDWGRPQRDGPALRATSVMAFATLAERRYPVNAVDETLWPIVKADLDYVASYWNQTGFDLWEEVNAASFFTSAVQHRSLMEGASFAHSLGHEEEAVMYAKQADNVSCFLQTYWNAAGNFITANMYKQPERSGLDANTVLASIHTFDQEAGCDAATFQPCSDKALANLFAFSNSFRRLYPINGGIGTTRAVALGRYPEDVYFGGNPWYLCTFAAAEQLYLALYQWDRLSHIEVTDTSLPFFKQFAPEILPSTYSNSTSVYHTVATAAKELADEYVMIAAQYTPADGSLAEQFDGIHGQPLSARDLTWSYASALTVFKAREGIIPPGWGAAKVRVSTVCESQSGPVSEVLFAVRAQTVPGEHIYILGDNDALQHWDINKAVKLNPQDYLTWKVSIEVPARMPFTYKYLRKAADGTVSWEAGDNRSIKSHSEGGRFTQVDTWR